MLMILAQMIFKDLFQHWLLHDSLAVPPFFCFTHQLYSFERKCDKDLTIFYLVFFRVKNTMQHFSVICWGNSLRLLKVTHTQRICLPMGPHGARIHCPIGNICSYEHTYILQGQDILPNLSRSEISDLLRLTWRRSGRRNRGFVLLVTILNSDVMWLNQKEVKRNFFGLHFITS